MSASITDVLAEIGERLAALEEGDVAVLLEIADEARKLLDQMRFADVEEETFAVAAALTHPLGNALDAWDRLQ